MARIKKFSNYVNEDYSFKGLVKGAKEIFGKAANWVSTLISKITGGEVPTIPSGPKQGLPQVAYFAAGEGKSIEQQMDDHFVSVKKGMAESEEMEEEEIENLEETEKIEEDEEFLKYPSNAARNVSGEVLSEMILKGYTRLVEGGFTKPIFIYGAPGIGKTEIVAQAADKAGVDLMFVDLQFMSPADFLGVPSKEDLPSDLPYGAGVTRDNPPVWLPFTNDGKNYKDKGGIIFFDEMNRTESDAVLNGMMVLTQQRRINQYRLPSKWYIVAAGNRPSDDTPEKIRDLGAPLFDRFTVVNYVPTVESFKKYVTGSEKTLSDVYGKKLSEIVIPELLSFLEFSNEYFHTLKPGEERFASPRGWINAAKSYYTEFIRPLETMEDKGKTKISQEELLNVFQDQVGFEPANAFLKFYKLVQSIPLGDVKKVFDDPQNAPLPPKKGGNYEPDVAFATNAAIVSQSEKLGTITPDQFSNAIDWAIRLDNASYASSFVSMLTSKHPYIKRQQDNSTQYATKDYLKNLARFNEYYFKDLA